MNCKSITGVAIMLVLATAGTAYAHAELQASDPQKNAVLKTAPAEVAIDFSESVDPKLSRIVVKDAHGKQVDKGDGHVASDNAKHFSVDLNPLGAGVYTVHWTSVAEDGHKLNGTFKFTIAP
jgi:copper resistance protein C